MSKLTVGNLTLDPLNGQVTIAPRRFDQPPKTAWLTPIQTHLLAFLMQHPGVPHSDLTLLHQIWGNTAPDTARPTVRQHIRFIRLKIEDDPSNPIHLVTRIRFGYMVPTPSPAHIDTEIIQAHDVLQAPVGNL